MFTYMQLIREQFNNFENYKMMTPEIFQFPPTVEYNNAAICVKELDKTEAEKQQWQLALDSEEKVWT